MSFDRFYNPADAAQLLADAGFTFSKTTLAKYRCLGGGPRFHKFGSRVLYRQPDLMEWAESRLSDSMANTADAGVAR